MVLLNFLKLSGYNIMSSYRWLVKFGRISGNMKILHILWGTPYQQYHVTPIYVLMEMLIVILLGTSTSFMFYLFRPLQLNFLAVPPFCITTYFPTDLPTTIPVVYPIYDFSENLSIKTAWFHLIFLLKLSGCNIGSYLKWLGKIGRIRWNMKN